MLVRATLFLIALIIAKAAIHAATPQPSKLLQIVEQYYQAHYELGDEKATNEDIDKIFALFSEDFVYDHPNYGGEYSRENLYAGYTRNLAQGRYRNSNLTQIHNSIVGKDMVVIAKDKGRVTLFEFRDNKIVRIREYW